MYLYYSEAQTADPLLHRVVEFRARVVSYGTNIIQGAGVYTDQDQQSDATIWFQCDLVGQIKAIDGGYLHASDFQHVKDVASLSALRNSIA